MNEGIIRHDGIMSSVFLNMNLLPKPITYEDIDSEVLGFVSSRFPIYFKGSEIKTFLLSHQRMSEFTKTWEISDDNGNIIPNNFKILSRETNPSQGSMMGGMHNIPGDQMFSLGVLERHENGKTIKVNCKMRQPYCVDVTYNLKIVTNKLYLLNEMNNAINNEFKSKQSYLKVNGQHFMPIVLDDIEDDSDYELNERKILSQNYKLKVSAYIINEGDILYEDLLQVRFSDVQIDTGKPHLKPEIKDGSLNINFPRKSKTTFSFKSDKDYNVANVSIDNLNVLSFKIYINGRSIDNSIFQISKYDDVTVTIERKNRLVASSIILILE